MQAGVRSQEPEEGSQRAGSIGGHEETGGGEALDQQGADALLTECRSVTFWRSRELFWEGLSEGSTAGVLRMCCPALSCTNYADVMSWDLVA